MGGCVGEDGTRRNGGIARVVLCCAHCEKVAREGAGPEAESSHGRVEQGAQMMMSMTPPGPLVRRLLLTQRRDEHPVQLYPELGIEDSQREMPLPHLVQPQTARPPPGQTARMNNCQSQKKKLKVCCSWQQHSLKLRQCYRSPDQHCTS